MIKYLNFSELNKYPVLKSSMHWHRGQQFAKRLKWNVKVDQNGHEFDEYDCHGAHYVILTKGLQKHLGSMRFSPATSSTMLTDHFPNLATSLSLKQSDYWETSRLCIDATQPLSNLATLLAASSMFLQHYSTKFFVGVINEPMRRLYKKLPGSPTIHATHGSNQHTLHLAVWEYCPYAQAELMALSNFNIEQHQSLFRDRFLHVAA